MISTILRSISPVPIWWMPLLRPIRLWLRVCCHCPLKGDASYLSLKGADGLVEIESIAWTYETPPDFAADLKGRVAFYTDKVTLEESPL